MRPIERSVILALAGSVLLIGSALAADSTVVRYENVACPARSMISLPVAASQMCAVLSSDVVTIREPSGLKEAEYTTFTDRTAISLSVVASHHGATRQHAQYGTRPRARNSQPCADAGG
jgi:hypothetical protein